MNAYIEMDSDLAIDVWEQDVAIDQIHNALFQNLLDLIGSSGDGAAIVSHLLFTAKNIERVGDHVTNIAEQIYFVNHGKFPEDDRPKADISSDLGIE
jgi:phosphate transport system protein